MEFIGPYRELLQRMYDRCVQLGWFGPEIDAPSERASRGVPDHVYCALLSSEQIQQELPFLDQYEYTYNFEVGTTTIKAHHDRRRRHFGYPPATPEQIAQTEEAIGFSLPPLLRDIYTQLGNGGFGYWQGFVGVAGGAASGELSSIDRDTTHAPKKMTDYVQDGLIDTNIVFKCYELPDRFIPWSDFGCAIYCWIDGWSGRLYTSGACPIYEWWQPEEDPDDEYEWGTDSATTTEALISPHLSYYENWEYDDNAEVTYFDLEVEEGIVRDWCYGIQYKAPSLEAWIEKWLASPLP
jgi:hypothetical protein